MVAAGLADEILVQISYAIGIKEPTSVYVNTYNTSKMNLSDGEIAKKLLSIFDLTPAGIEKTLKLRNPIYLETAAYGHMGKSPITVTKNYSSNYSGEVTKEVELFTWEKLDYVERLQKEFKI